MHIKRYTLIVLAIIAALFIVQNITPVEIRFLFWQLSMSRALMMLFLLLTGMIIGWLLHAIFVARRVSRSR